MLKIWIIVWRIKVLSLTLKWDKGAIYFTALLNPLEKHLNTLSSAAHTGSVGLKVREYKNGKPDQRCHSHRIVPVVSFCCKGLYFYSKQRKNTERLKLHDFNICPNMHFACGRRRRRGHGLRGYRNSSSTLKCRRAKMVKHKFPFFSFGTCFVSRYEALCMQNLIWLDYK